MENDAAETRRFLVKFLEEFKGLIYEGRLLITQRRKTQDALSQLGYTFNHLEPILLSLSVEDYYAGPKPDVYVQGDSYWEFGKFINARAYYIKVKIAQQRDGERAVCLSFHEAEVPLRFPFRTGRN